MRHVTVVGLPRSGKTTLCVEIFRRCPRAIFLNVAHEPYFDGVYSASNERDALTIADGERTHIVWNCNIWDVQGFLGKLIEMQLAREEKYPISIFVDEAHLVCPCHSINIVQGRVPNSFGLLATNGLRWNLRAIWISQRPQLVDSTIYRTAEYKIFFKLHSADISYLRRERIKVPEGIEGLRKYEWSVIEG